MCNKPICQFGIHINITFFMKEYFKGTYNIVTLILLKGDFINFIFKGDLKIKFFKNLKFTVLFVL